ncbi:phenylalanine--tRNA ligase subunit beta [Neomegalonema sp.]|uniref:phenylalanine--tRNA ligase subunit beta n=1 Tax=Neomegalonema sp. TaxID=2039713 RepID=UPI002602371D|nr:phenylalanine--tRNA ligase subunit beta [Neomegalonema sp.]MDD2867176.1 phenylalanine--tRNA ligase subunit beta [Neomegalonema sp.]
MKITLGWLKDHLETSATLDEIAAAMTDLGLEVEGIEDPASRLKGFVVARVVEAARIEGSDHLNRCRVDAGTGQEIQVVCGAHNARTGMKAVFAPVGTYIPGLDKTLKPGKLMGVESNGMLCSERELELSDEHGGIIELPEDAPVGVAFSDYRPADPVIEFKLTPNRPDALAARGVARDLAARGLGTLKPAPVEPVPGGFASPVGVKLAAEVAEDLCPHFVGRLIRGVKNGPSPQWLQDRLKAVGLRPINALVDVTNFFTLDRARPLHVYDAARLSGDILVRSAREGESLAALDGKSYELAPGMTVIADQAKAVGVGGIMGGTDTGCEAETTEVFLEGAWFDPIRTAETGRKLRINSDARYRFERGVDPGFTREGVEAATRMILELCGGEASDLVEAGAAPIRTRILPLRKGRLKALVGLDLAPETQASHLEALGFKVHDRGDRFEVEVPSWRPDVHGEADLVEETARVASLTRLESQPLARPPGVAKPVLTLRQKRTAAARRALAAAGLDEAVTWSFIPADQAELFGGGAPEMKLANPIASDLSDMRPSLLPGLLAAAARNQARGFLDLGLFEIGAEFFGPEPGEQRETAAGLLVGGTTAREWSGARRLVDAFDARGLAEAVLAALGAPVASLQVAREAPEWLHPGRSGALKLGPKNTLAVFGELHPRVVEFYGLRGPVAAFSVDLDALPAAPAGKTRARTPLEASDLQPVERDFAFVVESSAEAAAFLRAARGADKALIAEARIFDVFEGPRAEAQFGPGRKSVALTIRLQPRERTLTDAEIEAVSDKLVKAVAKATGASLRS